MSNSGEPPGGRCVFCEARDADAHELVIARAPQSYVILNLFPYNNGHLMVVPNRHLGTLAEATLDELTELMAMTQRAEMALREVYRPDGLNVGLNLGRSAGAGIVDHLHVHIVPRWTGDTNFMSVFGEVRVLPEQLEDTRRRLVPVFERLRSGAGHTHRS